MPVEFVFAAAVGLCVGSFANVVTHRLPRSESVVSPHSHCPGCSMRLKRRDMIPVISWLLLRGKCRYCEMNISISYPIAEIVSAGLFVLAAKHTGAALSVLPLWGLAFVLLCVSVIDWKTMEIPDGLLAVGVISAGLWVGLGGIGWREALLGAATGALPLFLLDRLIWKLAKKPGFGFGDVKLMAMAGLFLGWQGVPPAFFTAFVAGGAYGAWLLLSGKARRGSYLAFGPFLCAGVLVGLLVSR